MKFLTKAKYIKYTRAELERYTSDESSCVQKIHAREHLGISMAGLQNLRETISRILDSKIGRFDRNRNGIILDIRNTKVLDTPSQIRHDSADLHLDIESDFYVFQPRIGAIVTGVVKHISQSNIGVIIYRVFNVAVKFTTGMRNVKVNQEIKIRVLDFDLDNRVPEIQGELVANPKTETENDGDSGISTEDVATTLKIKQEKDSDAGPSKKNKKNGTAVDEDDIESFAKLKKRRSILVNNETSRRSTLPKHVSFSDTQVPVKTEVDKEQTPKKKKDKRLKSPSPPPKLDETGFNAFEELIEKDLQSTIIGSLDTSVTIKTEKSPTKKSKKRKRDTEDDAEAVEETQVIKKKKIKEEPATRVTIKKEKDDESSSQSDSKKSKKKDKHKNNSFHTTLESILDEAEVSSSSSSTQKRAKRHKVPKIKKEKV
ncbi:DNA-directed RNA polymerase I subunit RPA43 [Culicoides brevitarsis]|uniref:DNA-directed RNA polymerase I subunit RPA43 n=1 Tax=Culicoides brevitarsis TaxID=469753 RepID=UPI00307BA46A